ncbi:O-antigen ligase family protein [Paenibacillus oceani]|uniref:O-antigen ligase family protein n=1 Tax=Paenibacillus oceani TaxID=2772510 RepID=A0A927CH23_9BACL|nr:O-antigen ligase family protein [Paenibacillus oceani]MBD2866498.1 O-antigen ligase family protein [Paenibacillus oceani]
MLARMEFGTKKRNIGLLVACIYILLSYIGKQGIIDERLHSLSLYLLIVMCTMSFVFLGRFKLVNYHAWYITFITLSIISCLYALDINTAFGSVYNLIVVLGLTLALTWVINGEEDIGKILVCFSLSGFGLFTLLLATNQLFTTDRLGESLFGNANYFALIVMVSLMSSTWLLLYNPGVKKLLFALCVASEFYLLFLSGGRKYILVSALFLYILLILKKNKKGKMEVVKYTLVFIFIGIIGYWAMFNIPQLYNTVGYRMEGVFNIFSGEEKVKLPEDQIRQNMIIYGLDFFAQRPVFGFGIDNYKLMYGNISGNVVYAHNNFIELMVTHGLLGLVLYYSYYIFLIYKLLMDREDATKLRDFFLAFLICLFPLELGIVSYNMHFIQLLISLGSIYLYMKALKKKTGTLLFKV